MRRAGRWIELSSDSEEYMMGLNSLLRDKDEEIEELKARIEELEGDVIRLEGLVDVLDAQVEKLEASIDRATNDR